MNKKVKISEILDYLSKEKIKYTFSGNPDDCVIGFSSLKNYKDGTVTWVKNQANTQANTIGVLQQHLQLVVAQEGVSVISKNIIFTGESKRAFFKIMEQFWGEKTSPLSIGAYSYISDSVKIGAKTVIGANSVLNGHITIGDNTVIGNNVTIIGNVYIGNNCVIQSGAVIGHEGYSYTEDSYGHKEMVKHYGGVSIGDDVLIGSQTCVVRGTIDDTIIGDGCKIDNLCHIAHNVIIDKNVSIVAGSLIYGSVHISENAYIASAIVKNQLHVGQEAFLGMGCVVTKDVEAGITVAGVPAQEIRNRSRK